MKEPYASATIRITEGRFKEVIAQVCEIKNLKVAKEKKLSNMKVSFRLIPKPPTPWLAEFWSWELEATFLPDGIFLKVAGKSHNTFFTSPETRFIKGHHILELISSVLFLQEGQGSIILHSAL